MLENIPAGVGRALRNRRAGAAKLASGDDAFADTPETIEISSPAFADGAIPPRHSADGPGVSPALEWRLQGDAASLVLLVEDADSPTPEPFVHAIAWNLAPADGGLPEGALSGEPTVATGRNSYLRSDWLPVDPPTGHGRHRYAFQLFALDKPLDFDGPPGRSALIEAMRGHVLAKGVLVGTYERRVTPSRRGGALTATMLLLGAGLAGAALWRRRRKARLRSSAPVRYTPDVETITPTEAATFERIAEVMRAGGKIVAEREGKALRTSHAKAHGLLKGELRVRPDLPPELAQGMFVPGRTYPVLVRLAHVPSELLDDRRVSTPRGLSIKVIGVEGEMLPGHAGEVTQDLLLDSGGAAFISPNATVFLGQITSTEAATPLPEGVKAAVSSASRAANKALNAVGLNSANLDFYGHPFVHPLGESYFTQTPLRYGDHIAKLSATPASPGLKALIDRELDLDDYDGLRLAVIDYFRRYPAEFDLNVQLCTDLDVMPVENAHKAWSEDVSPYRPVARLVLPPQDAYNDARRDHIEGSLSFSPAHSLAAHRPLGSIMRARLHVYDQFARERRAANGLPAREPRSLDEIPD